MLKARFFFFLLLLLSTKLLVARQVHLPSAAWQQNRETLLLSPDTLKAGDTLVAQQNGHLKENKRFIAAVLAFPVPFGILGLHRIYLHTAPYVPVIYIVTLGGAGIISLLDFIEIVTADDATFATFENNPDVFMWGK